MGTLGIGLLSDDHVQMLRRLADRVVLIFDGDDAGQSAADRSLELFLAHEVDVRVLTLPSKLDPCDFLLAEGADAFQALVDQAVDPMAFAIRRCGVAVRPQLVRGCTAGGGMGPLDPGGYRSRLELVWISRLLRRLILSQRLRVPVDVLETIAEAAHHGRHDRGRAGNRADACRHGGLGPKRALELRLGRGDDSGGAGRSDPSGGSRSARPGAP